MSDRQRIQALNFAEFMKELRTEFLASDWEDIAQQQLLSINQGDGTFKDFVCALESHNAKLAGTSSCLGKDRLRQQLVAGMSSALRIRVNNSGANKQTDYKLWKEEVRRLDDILISTRAEIENVMKRTRGVSRPGVLFTDSRKSNKTASNSKLTSSSSTTNTRPPPLTNAEKVLLSKYLGCFKCRLFGQNHVSRDCKNKFPAATGYRERTLSDVPASVRAEIDGKKRTVGAVGYGACPRARSESPPRGRRVLTSYPSKRAREASNSSDERSQVGRPIAAVFGAERNPVSNSGYYQSSVLEGSSESNGDVVSVRSGTPAKVCDIVGAVISDVESVTVPSVGHLWWKAVSVPDGDTTPCHVQAMLDSGSHLDLVNPTLVTRLNLVPIALSCPETVSVAIGGKRTDVSFSHIVKFCLNDPLFMYTSRTVTACIAPNLSMDLLLGLPLLTRNDIVLRPRKRTAVCQETGFDLLNPTSRRDTEKDVTASGHANRRRAAAEQLSKDRKALIKQIQSLPLLRAQGENPSACIGVVRTRMEGLAAQLKLNEMGEQVKKTYQKVFMDISHIDELPEDVYCRIALKDAAKQITMRTYSTPRKYKEAWATLLQQHLDAGRIRPSNSQHASPAFIIPKADTTVLPRWVNDYRQLNGNTIPDSYPLPRIDDIMADAVKGNVWSVLDMTNSFFQTRVHPDDVHLTAVTTPFCNPVTPQLLH